MTIPYDQAYEAGFEDMPRRVPDLTKIHKAIGYAPKVQLDEIIDRVVAEKRSYAGAGRSITLAGRQVVRPSGRQDPAHVHSLNTVGTSRRFSVHFVNEVCIMPVQILNGSAGPLRFRCDWPCRRPLRCWVPRCLGACQIPAK